MSAKERDRLKVLHEVRKRHITQRQAAVELGISVRWVRSLLKRLRVHGDGGLRHRLRGKASNRKTPEELKRRAVEVFRQKKQARLWHDYGPTLAAEELAEQYGIEISRETLRHWLMEAKLWRPRRARVEQAHVWRARRSRYGELVQWDTSEHNWLEGRGEKLYLIAMIDDATSQLTARFVRHDSTEENLRQLRRYLEQHGRPVAVYTDKASLFQIAPRAIHHRDAPVQQLTQIGRALKELNIEWIAAHSPQAKGRIERSFQTAQDRLVKGLRQVGAKDLDSANQYLEQVYVPLWNRRFRREARMAGDAHRSLPADMDLDSVLSIRLSRTVSQDHTVSWQGVIYGIDRSQAARGMRGARVAIERRLDGSTCMRWQNQMLVLQRCQVKPIGSHQTLMPKPRARQERSPQEKALARQRFLAGRKKWGDAYKGLPDRPVWQAIKPCPPRTGGLL
ncbi:MAG TPA: ISNCY family transposase [Terriglobales bacterium]|nr:ISNCY family transposase [Terriglobales bacterium]